MTAVLFPLALLGARAQRDTAGVRGLGAAARGGLHGQLRLPRPGPVLPLLRADAGAGVLHHRRVGLRPAGLRRRSSSSSTPSPARPSSWSGILAIAFIHQSQTGVLTFELPALMHTHLSGTEGVLLFLAFTAAFAVKAPIFPFHTWSPDAYAEAPTAGAPARGRGDGQARHLRHHPLRPQPVPPGHPRRWRRSLLTLATIGILYGALVACAQRDLKRLLAYSSLAQIGFIVLGTFALNSQGLTGGVLQMVNHGLIIATLFILVGWIYERRADLAGRPSCAACSRRPRCMAGVFTVAMLASIGVPGLNGFVGEFLVLIGTFLAHRWWAVVATFGVVIAAIYLLWAYQQVFHGEPTEEDAGTRDLVVDRAADHRPADHPDRVPRRLPQAGARPDHPVGQPAGRPRRPGHPHPPAPAGRAPRDPGGRGPGPASATQATRDNDRRVRPVSALALPRHVPIPTPHDRLPEHPPHADHAGRGGGAAAPSPRCSAGRSG